MEPHPDPTFRLTPAERAAVPDEYDPDALERLLAYLDTESRRFFLRVASAAHGAGALTPDVLARDFPAWFGNVPRPPRRPDGPRASLPPQLEDFRFEPEALQRLLEATCRGRPTGLDRAS